MPRGGGGCLFLRRRHLRHLRHRLRRLRRLRCLHRLLLPSWETVDIEFSSYTFFTHKKGMKIQEACVPSISVSSELVFITPVCFDAKHVWLYSRVCIVCTSYTYEGQEFVRVIQMYDVYQFTLVFTLHTVPKEDCTAKTILQLRVDILKSPTSTLLVEPSLLE